MLTEKNLNTKYGMQLVAPYCSSRLIISVMYVLSTVREHDIYNKKSFLASDNKGENGVYRLNVAIRPISEINEIKCRFCGYNSTIAYNLLHKSIIR